jgi:hypothetical protein
MGSEIAGDRPHVGEGEIPYFGGGVLTTGPRERIVDFFHWVAYEKNGCDSSESRSREHGEEQHHRWEHG